MELHKRRFTAIKRCISASSDRVNTLKAEYESDSTSSTLPGAIRKQQVQVSWFLFIFVFQYITKNGMSWHSAYWMPSLLVYTLAGSSPNYFVAFRQINHSYISQLSVCAVLFQLRQFTSELFEEEIIQNSALKVLYERCRDHFNSSAFDKFK